MALGTEWEQAPERRASSARWKVAAAVVAVVALLALARVEFAEVGGELTIGEPTPPSADAPAPAADVATAETSERAESGERGQTTRPPIGIGVTWLCPPGHRVPTYADPPLAYPGGHPEAPGTDVRPVTCARTLDDAVAIGFAVAPPPEDVEVAGGVYLVETGAPLFAACEAAARELDHAVACPSRLPSQPTQTPCAQPAGPVHACVLDVARNLGEPFFDGVTGFVLDANGFPATAGAACPTCSTAVTVAVEPAARPTSITGCFLEPGVAQPPAPNAPEYGTRCDGDLPLGLTPWRVAPHEGHFTVRWQVDDVIVAVSAGLFDPDAAEALAFAIAQDIELVHP